VKNPAFDIYAIHCFFAIAVPGIYVAVFMLKIETYLIRWFNLIPNNY